MAEHRARAVQGSSVVTPRRQAFHIQSSLSAGSLKVCLSRTNLNKLLLGGVLAQWVMFKYKVYGIHTMALASIKVRDMTVLCRPSPSKVPACLLSTLLWLLHCEDRTVKARISSPCPVACLFLLFLFSL